MVSTSLTPLTPKQKYEDNMRPALLLVRVYRLLDSNDTVHTTGDLVDGLRKLVNATDKEDMMLIYNELFLGLVRERSDVKRKDLYKDSLNHLLRQAVVASCTALETYLPSLLQYHLPAVIKARGRDFLPTGDKTTRDYFADLKFTLDQTMRLLGDDTAPAYIAERMVNFVNYKYMSTDKGIHVACALLGVEKPWKTIAEHLSRNEEELIKTLNDTVHRRNDIVHRADRPEKDPGGVAQDISLAWAEQAVSTINIVCLAVDEIITRRVGEMHTLVEGASPTEYG